MGTLSVNRYTPYCSLVLAFVHCTYKVSVWWLAFPTTIMNSSLDSDISINAKYQYLESRVFTVQLNDYSQVTVTWC